MDIQKIAAVLKGKTLGKGRLYNPVTQLRCAVGELLHAAGVPDTTLELDETMLHLSIETALRKQYGLSPSDAADLTDINDRIAPKRTKIKGDDVIRALIG